MNYRNSILLSPEDVGASGTKSVDLDFLSVISRLTIIFSTTNPGTTVMQEHPAANIPKVEVVDGSNVICSLTGMQAQALEFFDTGKLYPGGGSIVPAWNLVTVLVINFGRFLFDPLLGFDPKKFSNPQLKITFDEDAAVGSTVANTLAVLADLFDEKTPAPTGFLMNKELMSYTPVASATEEIDLPSDFTHRKLIIQARVNDLWLGGIISNVKLSEDNDKRVPIDLPATLLESLLHSLWGECSEHVVADLDTNTGVHIWHAATQGIKLRGDFYCTSALLDNVPFGYSNLYKTTTQTGYQPMDIAGQIPHGCLCLPFGDQNDPADWYVVTGKGLKLKIKAGANIGATEEFHIITQQLRPY